MGIFWIRSKRSNKAFLETAQNVKGMMNRVAFQLNASIHPNEELQKEWREFGEEQFTVEILEELEYDKDETKTDYSEELAMMKYIWEEKIAKEGIELYKNRLS